MIFSFIIYRLLARQLNPNLRRRWDGSPALPYFRSQDLGLAEEGFSFVSGKWHLSGSRYWRPSPEPFKALVIVFHGLGAGRTAYLKEIAALCEQGYLVYAYDNTGCMQSQGPCIYGLGQTLRDQKAFFAWLDQDKKSQGLRRYVFGHSWGGYGALMACQNDYKIEKCVALAGFVSPLDEYVSFVPKGKLKPFKPWLRLYLWNHLGKEGNVSALKTLKKSSSKILYIQGDQDTSVPPEAGLLALRKVYGNDPRFTFLSVAGASHNVYMTKAAADYGHSLVKAGLLLPEGPIGLTMDLDKATQEDPKIMKSVFDFLSD